LSVGVVVGLPLVSSFLLLMGFSSVF